MANTVTPLTPITLQNAGSFFGVPITPYQVHHDTPGQVQIDIETGKRIYLVGWEMVIPNDATCTVKSGSTVLTALEFGSNSGMGEPFCPSNPAIIAVTEQSAALNLDGDIALGDFLVFACAI